MSSRKNKDVIVIIVISVIIILTSMCGFCITFTCDRLGSCKFKYKHFKFSKSFTYIYKKLAMAPEIEGKLIHQCFKDCNTTLKYLLSSTGQLNVLSSKLILKLATLIYFDCAAMEMMKVGS